MRRRLSTLLLTLGSLLLVGAMAAWACTNLATLNLEKASGSAGESIGVTGSSFATSSSSRTAGPVEIRWDGVDGAVLASVEPDAAGNIATSATIPADATPGYHVLVATQSVTSSEGEVSTAYGTPARAAFSVGGVVPEAPAVASGPSSAVSSAGTSGGLVALTALLAIGGLALFGAGVGLFVRELRPREAPARAKSE